MTPEEVDKFLEYAQIYHNGIKINDVFYTFEDLDEMKMDELYGQQGR